MPKGNTKNLMKGNPETQFRAGREQSETARKGGIASGAARRRKGAARKIVSEILSCNPKLTNTQKAQLERLGMDPESGITQETIIWLGMIKKAAIDVSAARLILEMLQEDPKTLMEEKRLKAQKEAFQTLKNSDGFMTAMTGLTEEVFEDGGDTPDTLEDSE